MDSSYAAKTRKGRANVVAASSEGRRGRPLIFGSKSPLERATLALEVHRAGEAEVRCALEHTGKAARFDSRRQAARCSFFFHVDPILLGRGLFLQCGGNSGSYCCATEFASEGERIEGCAAGKLSVVLGAVSARHRAGDATSPVYYRTELYTRNTYSRESLPVVTCGLRNGRRGVF